MAFRVGGNFHREKPRGRKKSFAPRRPKAFAGIFFDHVVAHGEIFSPTLKATWLRKCYHFRDKHEGMDSDNFHRGQGGPEENPNYVVVKGGRGFDPT